MSPPDKMEDYARSEKQLSASKEEIAWLNKHVSASQQGCESRISAANAAIAMKDEALKIAQAVMADNKAGLKVVDDALSATPQQVSEWEENKLEHLRQQYADKCIELSASQAREAELHQLLSAETTAKFEYKKHAEEAEARIKASSSPLTEGYVQSVPDKCDRIVWRNAYYHLPIAQPPIPPDVAELQRKNNSQFSLILELANERDRLLAKIAEVESGIITAITINTDEESTHL